MRKHVFIGWITLPRELWGPHVAEVERPRQLPGLVLAGVLVTPGGITLWERVSE